MQFVSVALSVLALLLGVVRASFLPFHGFHGEVAGHGLSYTAVSAPAVVAAPWHSVPVVAHETVVVGPSPSAYVVPAPHVDVHHDATYVAKTRGAVHTAPLAGHLNSVANVNLAAAPGTH